MREFSEDDIQRIFLNPFYTITVNQQLIVEHTPYLSETEWIESNVETLTQNPEQWFRRYLDILVNNNAVVDEYISPYIATNILPIFASPHEPLLSQEQWILSNVMAIGEMTPRIWLQTELEVLQGNYPVGSSPSPKKYRASARRQQQKAKRNKRLS